MAELSRFSADSRVQWMRQRVALALEISLSTFDDYFSNENGEKARETCLDFLSSKCSEGNVLFFACKKTSEDVDVEIEVEETVEEDVVEVTSQGNAEEGDTEGIKTDEAIETPSDEQPASDALHPHAQPEDGKSDETNENQPVEQVEEAKPLTRLVKKIVTETREKFDFYMALDEITSSMIELTNVYFVRCFDGEVPKIGSTDMSAISNHLEFSIFTGDVISNLANLMSQVYLPAVQKGKLEDSVEVNVDNALRHELGSNVVKFEQQLRHVIQQSQGDSRLKMPSLVITTPEAAVNNLEIVSEIEGALEGWTAVVSNALEAEIGKFPKRVRTPQGEIEFWRERYVSLSTLYEQIITPKVQQMLTVMKIIDNPQLNSFNYHFGELTKYYSEAKDNVKFLTTLERHFRHLHSSDFATIIESIPSMVNGLRMVWTISRHYNKDDYMIALMENISEMLARRVRSEVRVSEVVLMQDAGAYTRTNEAKDALLLWSETYFKMRKKIEENSDHRWEFGTKELFGKTNYMSEICANIVEVANASGHFRTFLGPELKAVTGDAAGIDAVLQKVDDLTVPFQIPFEEKVFDRSFEKPWDAMMKRFRSNVQEIQKMTEKFIKMSFRKLRSAEAAFDLILNFQKIGTSNGTSAGFNKDFDNQGHGQTRQAFVKQQMFDRYQDILEQYMRELEAVRTLFESLKDCPPLYKNFPPISGAIAWSRDLYERAKRPIMRFKKHGGILEAGLGEKVKLAYLDFARKVDDYQSALYNDWESYAPAVVAERLKQPILMAKYQQPASAQSQPQGSPVKGAGATALPPPVPITSTSQVVLPPPPYHTNFPRDLFSICAEARFLDKLGFKVPETPLNAALMVPTYQSHIKAIIVKLVDYDRIMNSLSPIEKQLMSSHIDAVNDCLKTGFYPLNWVSQRIPAFIEEIGSALVRFASIVSQVHKNAAMVDDIVQKISKTQLISEEDFASSAEGDVDKILDISEFYDRIEAHRIARLDALTRDYISIGETFLIKIEEIVLQSTTGRHPGMEEYYHYWERALYNAIVQMVIRSMAALMGILQCKDRPPLFRVVVSLNGKEFVVSPSLTEVDKILTKSVRLMAESAKAFVRWVHGTCVISEPLLVNEDEEPFVFHFYRDVSKNAQVVKLALSLTTQTNRVYSITNKYLDGWRRYDKVTNLWNPKRKQQIEKLRASCSNLDSAMGYYKAIRDTIDSQPVSKETDFLQVDMSLIAAGVARQADQWKIDYGEVLLTTSHAMLQKLQERMTYLESSIDAPTSTLEELKFVLNTVAEVQSTTPDVELDMLDVIERYRTLARYNIQVPLEETEAAFNIDKRWRKLYVDARTRDLRLVDTKKEFRAITVQDDLNFRSRLEELRKEFLDAGPGVSSINLDDGVELLQLYGERVAKLSHEKQELINAQNLFNLDVKPYPTLQQTQAQLEQLEKIYGLYLSLKEFQENMASTMWSDLDISTLLRGADDLEKLGKKFPKELKEIYTFKLVEAKLVGFKEALPLVASLKGDAMKVRHWQKLADLTGVQFDTTLKTLTLQNIFAMELHRFAADVEEIVNEAVQEGKIENELAKMDLAWQNNALGVMKYKKDGHERGYVLKAADDLKLELDDNMLNLQTISGSRFVGSFVDRVRKWEKTLNLVSECLDMWFTVQKKWVYLEGIFVGAEDIRLQLPEEAKKFDSIDKTYKGIMIATSKNPNVVDACTSDNRLSVLTSLSERLDVCQKSLSDYLNTKRASFPRFFFISDDELLSVLGNTDPTSIQVHLLKLFDNVKELKFGRNNKIVEGMSSVEKEGFTCRTATPIEGPVENWMTACETEMKVSLKDITKEGVFIYAAHDRCEWLKIVLGMVGLVGSQIWWTWEVEDTFRQVLAGNKYAMKDLEGKLTGQLNDLVAMVRDKLDDITRKKVNTLLIIDVHARDIVDGFVRESVLNAKEFAWESQLRFYWDRDVDDCVIKQCTGKFRYGYEYMGLNGRLVITPLTDRCYMTLTQALTFKLGGSPAGPAGTGKTETTKDLAKSLALPCFVINCGDGLDYKAMASIFSGLVQVGAWGCFDEFNRINIEVLSVVSAQLRAIQNALIYDRPTCDIGIGGDMLIKRVAGFATCGFFITMNPGYAGRTELPDNLKALFRPVTMIVPDLQQICEIMLFSEGFEGAKVLAKKMTVLYKLSKEQLSKQFHYDFGLRALKSVLVMAGGLKRQYKDMPEDLVLMRCLRDSNIPKFIFEDVPLFLGLIGDLFPGMNCPRVGYEDLKTAARDDLESRGFRCSNETVFADLADKVIQMYETQLVRHTTMIVGPTGGGKSVVLETLKNARFVSERVVVKMSVLNPKAQPLNELYGEMDPATRDWTDGILSKIFRELNEPLPPGKENEMRWIVYDGDVDALWVENMNSVMDDNRLLTLPNGERIRLQPHCAMICETFDLQYASPATISRCGMVWVDPKNLGYKPYYERWVRMRYGNSVTIEEEKQTEADVMMNLFDKYVPKCIDMILSGLIDGNMGTKLKLVIPITNIDMVKQLCSVVDAFIPLEITDQMDIEMLYIFSIIWSLGAALVRSARTPFDAFLKDLAQEALPSDLLYEYFYDTSKHRWEKWQSIVPAYSEPSPFRFYEVMVPTTDSVLYSHMLKMLAPLKPILFVGESGTAKTTIIQKYLSDLPSASFSRLNINFSSRTAAADVQVNIEANIDKRTGSIYGPPSGKKLIVFVDDMNMPKVDNYGTQQPIALLLFLMGKGCLYDREKDLNLKTIKDLQYIGAMGPPGGGRNPVDPRFIALFNVFNLTPPTAAVLDRIYSSIINARYQEFSDSVKGSIAKITDHTLRLYSFIVDKMPPTPSKFHYIFNLRDISRVYEGLCNANPEIIDTPGRFIRLWRSECDRVFCDRLTTLADQNIYNTEVFNILKEHYSDSFTEASQNPVLFGDFEGALERITAGGGGEDLRLYQDMGDYTNVRRIFSGVLEQYNQDNKAMTLVLFEQALEHLCRIHRVIRNPRGNALLIGIGGSGKQSLTKLATYCAGYKLFVITLSRGYGEDQFKEDLKELYRQLGTGEVVFLFTDAHVVEEGFLEFINNMLTTGMVPALYEMDEKDALCNTVRHEVKKAGLPETPDNLWAFYISKCRNNLHIVLAMSPSGSKLRLRCRNFPGLVSNAVIDWFFPWPADALQKVAEFFLAEEALPEEHRAAVISHLVFTHQNVTAAATRFAEELRRFYYVTPKNYLDFISNYRLQLSVNGKQIQMSTKRLEGGLQKLIEAAAAVDRMQIVLTEKKVVVDEKTKNVQALISVIQEKSTAASAQQEEAESKQKYAGEQALIIATEKAKADEALEEALPAVEAASRALENLDKNDLTELKAFTNPPAAVMALCKQLVCLRPTGEKLEETWPDAKKMLGNAQLLNLLKNFPKDDIKEAQIKKVNKYFTEDLTLEKMSSVSKAGYGLLSWVVAIVKYYDVARNVKPLRDKVKAMEQAQRQTEIELAQLRTTLDALSKEISELNKQYAEANAELDILQQEASLMSKRLLAASALISGLTGERQRWANDVKNLEKRAFMLVGDCLIGSSFLSYLGAFTTDYRREMIFDKFIPDVQQRNIPLSENFTIENLLTTDAIVQGWTAKGLPADDHSVQNGILTTKGSRFPLCIDPQQQAITWIKRTYADKKLTVKSLTDSDFMKHLELAIQFGNPFLFENLDEDLDPMLDPVLEKNIVKVSGAKMIKLGDKMVEWDDNFRLFFTTKLANPHYSPEIMGKTMIINYGVTMDGLANQLLNVVVGHERPDLERQWADLVTEMGENAQLLVTLEDTLLRELSTSQGNILDNNELIATLENTKSTAVEIQGKLQQAQHTKEDISVARMAYKPVAKRGSILYFAEAGLATISSMYEISLDSFLTVFKAALSASKKDSVLETRLVNMIKTVTRQIYDYTCTGIFERHKLLFSFQLTCMVMNGEGKLDNAVLDFFLKGDTSLEGVSEACPASWLVSSGWKDLMCVSQINEQFSMVLRDFKTQPEAWKRWYDLETPETNPFPGDQTQTLLPLEKLAVMRCFRPDRVYNAVKLFVMEMLGKKFVQPPVLDYNRIFSQSSPLSPMVFILSPGADPQSDIQKFCDEMGMSARFKFVALGQGQGPIAEQLLEVGFRRGNWVLLQNCHLLTSWLKVLEKMLNEMKEPHKDFRLWCTTEPTDKFPLGILQRSLKIVTEPPDGLKLNMRATYSRIDTSMLEECPHWAFRPCLYVLAFLHAVVLERRKYGKIGWNVNYDFNESDFNISRRLLSLYLQKSFEDGDEFLPWGSLKYLVGDAMYGGRVSDDMDRRILKTYLEEYMGDFLFDDCQKFSFSRVDFDYVLPEWGPIDNYTKMIETFELTNSPAVFGLHPNAEIGYYSNAVKSMWLDLISLQPRRAAVGEGMSREDYISATAKDISGKIPLTSMDVGSYDLLQTRALLLNRNGTDVITPCQVVLLQEIERWNNLVKRMASSLQDLEKALAGEIGMSDELDSLGDSLYNGFLPTMWRRLCPDTQKPLGSWMLHYSRRYSQYDLWINTGEPAVMWLSGLHIPESYLTALVQTTCRTRGWPLDKSTLYTVVTKTGNTDADIASLSQLDSGCYITGLYLEGAGWDVDRQSLRVQDPKVLVVELPIMQVIPIEASKLKLHNTFRTPVYVTQARRNAMGVGLVFEADLATAEHTSHWVLQGVSLCLNIDS